MSLPPASKLGRYRVLSPSCGLRISPLQLGAMSIGKASASTLGSMDKKNSFKLLDNYYEMGGNFIDTANAYQDEESEVWIGEWLKQKGVRDDMVIATKYTANYKMNRQAQHPISINRSGNSYKSMFLSLEASLEKLQTSYVDILYIHWWDWTTPIPEIMQGLNNLIKMGKVLYLGVSDTPAWVVSRANEYARNHGLAPFVIYQGRWSAAARDLERDILPMCISEGMAIAPWGAIGQGRFQLVRRRDRNILRTRKVADQLKVESITAVALAYVMAKYPYVYPVVGGRKVEHFKANLTALDIHLTHEQIEALDSALPFDYGSPLTEFGLDPHMIGYQQHPSIVSAGLVDYVSHRHSINMTMVREKD